MAIQKSKDLAHVMLVAQVFSNGRWNTRTEWQQDKVQRNPCPRKIETGKFTIDSIAHD